MPERGGTTKNLYCIGTLDTKSPEIHFLAECLSSALSRFQLDNVSCFVIADFRVFVCDRLLMEDGGRACKRGVLN
jgi:uncharacterized protein (UPF0261 family)